LFLNNYINISETIDWNVKINYYSISRYYKRVFDQEVEKAIFDEKLSNIMFPDKEEKGKPSFEDSEGYLNQETLKNSVKDRNDKRLLEYFDYEVR